jgi:hypothetical protein
LTPKCRTNGQCRQSETLRLHRPLWFSPIVLVVVVVLGFFERGILGTGQIAAARNCRRLSLFDMRSPIVIVLDQFCHKRQNPGRAVFFVHASFLAATSLLLATVMDRERGRRRGRRTISESCAFPVKRESRCWLSPLTPECSIPIVLVLVVVVVLGFFEWKRLIPGRASFFVHASFLAATSLLLATVMDRERGRRGRSPSPSPGPLRDAGWPRIEGSRRASRGWSTAQRQRSGWQERAQRRRRRGSVPD